MRTLPDLKRFAPHEITGQVVSTVTQADTAQTLGSGDVPVLGTPRVLALAEAATVSALTRRMPTNWTSVGTRVVLRHVAAAPLGCVVTAAVVVRKIDGKRLTFTFRVTDPDGALLAEGEIERALVDREEFMSRLSEPKAPSAS